VRGVSPALLEAVRIEERDSPTRQPRRADLDHGALLRAHGVLYGALNAALDTTRANERGSLEPLLMNPRRGCAGVGKWGAVASVAS